MATVDELVVKLGLDAAGFTKGAASVSDALDKTKKDAVASGNVIEDSMARAGESFMAAGRKLLGLYALFTAGRGLKEFIADVTSSDAALGRMARNMDTSGKALSTWRNASEAAGGSAEATGATLAKLSSEMQTAALTGTSSVIPAFRALGIGLADAQGHARSLDAIMYDMNRKAQGMDPARFAAIARMAGFDDGTINLLEMSTDAFDKLHREQEKYAATAADIDAAQKRQTGFRELLITSTSLGRTILTALTPAITGAMEGIQKWANANQEWIKTKVVEYAEKFKKWVESVDWAKVGNDFLKIANNASDIASAFANVVKKVDGDSPLVKAFEAFGVLLALRILAPLVAITKAVGGLSGIPLTGVLAALGGAAYLGNNTMSNVDPWRDQSTGETALRALDPGIADRVYGKRGEQLPHGPRHGIGTHAAPHDTRNLWQRTMPKVLGGKDAPMAVNKDLTPEARALLDTIAGTESPGYNVEYGGKRFSSYADHPREGHLIKSGPNAGKTSNAAGRYQFLSRTWDAIAKEYGLKDFSPENQDKGAWYLAQRDYRLRTGRDLGADLKSKDPKVIAGIGHALRGTWTSLPGGIEAGTNGGKFASAFNHNLDRENKKSDTPVKVEMTDKSAEKVGKAATSPIAFTSPYGGKNTLAGLYGAGWLKHPAMAGIGRHHGLGAGARAMAAINHARHMTNHSTHHEETHVGELHVHTPTTDGHRFAGDFQGAARQRNSVVTQANAGLA